MKDLDGQMEQLLSIKSQAERAAFLLTHPHLTTVEAARVLCRTAVAETTRDLDRVTMLCETLDDLAAIRPDRAVQGYRAHAWAARCARSDSDYKKAASLWKVALEHFDAAGRSDEAAITCYCGLISLHLAGENGLFWEWEERARLYFEGNGDRLRLARLRANLGAMYLQQHEWSRAAALLEPAFDDMLLGCGTSADIETALTNLAICYQELGDLPRASALLVKARRVCEDADLARELGVLQTNLAFIHFKQGDFLAALEELRRGREHLASVGAADSHNYYLTYLLEADILETLRIPADGQRLAKIALDGFCRLGLPADQGKALLALGRCAGSRGRPKAAMQFYDAATRLFVSCRHAEGQRLASLESAITLFQAGARQRSLEIARSLLDDEEHLPLPLAIQCRLLLARVLLELGQFEDARAAAEAVVSRVAALDQAPLEAQAFLVLGSIHERLEDLSLAHEFLRRSEACTSRIRNQLSIGRLRTAFLSDKTDIYEHLFSVGVSLGQSTDNLLNVVERSKSRTLAEQLAQRQPSTPHLALASPASDLHEIWDGLRNSRRRLEHIARHPESPPRLEAVKDRVARAEEAARALLEERGRLPPRSNSDSRHVDEILGSLPTNSALVEFFFARETCYAFVVTGDIRRLVPLTSVSEIERLWRLVMFQMRPSTRGTSPKDPAENLIGYLSGLYDHLWRKVLLPDRITRVVLVPHGFLHALPFHALFDGEHYLSERYAFTHAPSAKVFFMSRTQPRDARLRKSVIVGSLDDRTPGIATEIRDIAAALPESQVLVHDQATKELLAQEVRNARFVHIAAHGQFTPGMPQASAVSLGDGMLTVEEIEQLEISADLVVLSGCETGRNATRRPDELIGLTQALLTAGARAVLVSLWPVDDTTTATLMHEFYTRLSSDRGFDEVLQSAMAVQRSASPQPFFWAPFVLVGDPGPAVD